MNKIIDMFTSRLFLLISLLLMAVVLTIPYSLKGQGLTYILLNGTIGQQPSITYTPNNALCAQVASGWGTFVEGRAVCSGIVIQDGTDRLMRAMESLKQNNPVLFEQVMEQYGLQFNEPSR